jgi:hypothetical protein
MKGRTGKKGRGEYVSEEGERIKHQQGMRKN